jgi:hypothetical protein
MCHTKPRGPGNSNRGEQAAKYFLGFCLHALLGSVGSFAFSMTINAAITTMLCAFDGATHSIPALRRSNNK